MAHHGAHVRQELQAQTGTADSLRGLSAERWEAFDGSGSCPGPHPPCDGASSGHGRRYVLRRTELSADGGEHRDVHGAAHNGGLGLQLGAARIEACQRVPCGHEDPDGGRVGCGRVGGEGGRAPDVAVQRHGLGQSLPAGGLSVTGARSAGGGNGYEHGEGTRLQPSQDHQDGWPRQLQSGHPQCLPRPPGQARRHAGHPRRDQQQPIGATARDAAGPRQDVARHGLTGHGTGVHRRAGGPLQLLPASWRAGWEEARRGSGARPSPSRRGGMWPRCTSRMLQRKERLCYHRLHQKRQPRH